MKTLPGILVVDDEKLSLESIRRILGDRFDVHTAENAIDAERILQQQWIQVLLCDQRMPGMTGIEFCQLVRDQYPTIIRIIISGYTDSNDIIDAINKGGIYQYIAKPWHPDELISKLSNAVELFRLQRENEQLTIELKLKPDTIEQSMIEKRRVLKSRYDWDQGIVRSPDSCMNNVCALVRNVSPYDVNVLLSGESGTGKELCARALHYNSLRQDKPFIAENCGALPDELLESELFGHKRGAFTGAIEDRVGLFERADGGTIFLDEIGETSPAFQVKLLRVLQEGEIRPLGSNQRRSIDVRVIAATNRNMEEDVRSGKFRQDLFYRLATFEILIPPLRERKADIVPLAIAILNQSMDQLGKRVKGISDEALKCFEAYHWPGNVREMQNEIKRMLVLGQSDYLGSNLVSPKILQAAPEESLADMGMLSGIEGPLKQRIESLEAIILKETLMRLRWNKTQTAQELGLSRVGLRNKMERYGLEKNSKLETITEVA
ncbi:MAG: sigma-54-dependent Fis family transcriptional regulator [Gammaproteobacteria bacterium]|nr:sigma-54-dependent Fis family transcriptional regulator [Gammaproteobacteria bacterium]MBL6998852.1 sigma-54-dependent Fis family transcriptional regulator [Gammaproteobacteria bacterium]